MAASKYDLSNWTPGKVSLFQALGIKGATYPQFAPRLLAGSVINDPGPAGVGITGATQSGGNGAQATAGGPISIKGLHNPLGPGLIPGRVDQGVDYSGSGPLYAVGNGTITNVYNSGWPGGTYINLQLDNGRNVYYAENISPQVRVNQKVQAGDIVGWAKGAYPYIEIGWSASGNGTTMAASYGQIKAGQAAGDPGAFPTAFGVSFNNLIKALGGRPGSISGNVQGKVPAGW